MSDFDLEDELARVTAERDKALRAAAKNSEAARDVRQLRKRVLNLEDDIAFRDALSATPASSSPDWLQPKRNQRKERGTLFLLLSDLHLDEVVNPAEIHDLNGYNRQIATQRLSCTVEKVCRWADDQRWLGMHIQDAVVIWGGDLVTGEIHEELTGHGSDATSNLDSILHWQDVLPNVVHRLLESVKRVHNVAVVGNHGRLDRKPRAKLGVVRNADYHLMRQVQRSFDGDKRVTWDIPQSFDVRIEVGGTQGNYLVTHGDQFRGGSGIAGVLSPIKRGQAQKQQRAVAIDQPFDWLVMGHFHTVTIASGLIVNGSLKGTDEYAVRSNFGLEPPSQMAWVHSHEHGPVCFVPVYSMDRGGEGW